MCVCTTNRVFIGAPISQIHSDSLKLQPLQCTEDCYHRKETGSWQLIAVLQSHRLTCDKHSVELTTDKQSVREIERNRERKNREQESERETDKKKEEQERKKKREDGHGNDIRPGRQRRLTHDRDLIKRPVPLSCLLPRHVVPESDGAQRDKAKVHSVQEGPVLLQRVEDRRRHHEEAQHHHNRQTQEVDLGG